MKTDYNKQMEDTIASLPSGEKPQLLLHTCCAPCASAVIERLAPYFYLTVFFYNPNIRPREEYEKRAAELPKLLQALNLCDEMNLIIADYDETQFSLPIAGLGNEPEGGIRCPICFRLRLAETAREAVRQSIPYFATTLTVSPHKNADVINALGTSLAPEYGVKWLPSDFKKRDGYLRSVRLCQRFGIYRQNYCGCNLPET